MNTVTKPVRQKILYVITKGNFGGAQRYVFDLATSLPKDQFDVAVAYGEGTILKQKLLDAQIRMIEITTLGRDVNFLLDIKSFFELIALFRKERPDVVHLNSSKIGGLGGLAARIVGIPHIIFTGHGWAWNEERFFLSKIIIAILHYATIVLSHTTIAVSEQVKTQITRFPFISKKIKVIYNGAVSFTLKEGFEARQLLAPASDYGLCIGTISELHTNKGLDYLIDAFAEISSLYPHVGLIIIGEGTDRRTLESRITKHKLAHKVTLTGYVENAKSYLHALDIFTLTSRTEAFPYVLLEAGLAKLPIVASNVGGISEIIEHKKTGLLIQKENIKEISDALSQLLDNEQLRLEYGKNIEEKVKNNFSHEKMLAKTIELYR